MSKPTKYDRILARTDKRRPQKLNELLKEGSMFEACGECFVMKISILTPHGSTRDVTWTEKDANEMMKRDERVKSQATVQPAP